MDTNIFIPRTQTVKQNSPKNEPISKDHDIIGFWLLRIAQWSTVLIGVMLVIFFTPHTRASLHFDKVTLVITLVTLALGGLSLLMLRRRSSTTVLPLTLAVLAGMTVVAFVSALFSGDIKDAVFGTQLEVHTAGFTALLLIVSTLPLVLQHAKKMVQRFFLLWSGVVVVLVLFHLVRLLLGPAVLSFGTFTTVTASPLGSFNDVAIFSGLVAVISIVTTLFIRLSRVAQVVISIVMAAAITLLAVVNFSLVWYILGLFSLLTFIYLISTPPASTSVSVRSTQTKNRLAIVFTGVLCVVSVAFIIMGQPLSQWLIEKTGASYVEVRPSPVATLDIMRGVYEEQIWFGVGPNRFADAWRTHKDTSLNQTIFWDTDFAAGYGYVPTLFVTTGVVGGILMVLFHLLFIAGGVRTLMQRTDGDEFWYFTACVSFASALFIMVMSYVYVPSATLLLLGAFFTGLTFASYSVLRPVARVAVPLVRNRQLSFVFMGVSVVTILVAVYVAQLTVSTYLAARDFGKNDIATAAVQPSETVQLARLLSEVRTLESLLSSTPTEEIQKLFLAAAAKAITLADELVADDATEPQYHFARGKVYAYLALTGVEGALATSEAAFATAEGLDTSNPKYAFARAQLYFQIGDIVAAREAVDSAIALKRNYAEALFLLTQIDVAEGNTEAAVVTAEALITLEPNNPARYYQLGVLYNAIENHDAAIVAFDQALARNQSFANARYFKALSLIALNQDEQALIELKAVRETNQSNLELESIITALESGEEVTIPVRPLPVPLTSESGTDTSSFDDAESELISPVNTGGAVIIAPELPSRGE